MVRVVLAGGTLASFEPSPATDSYVNARFVPAGSPVTVPFEPDDVHNVAADLRPRPRRYTVRRWDPARNLLSIDFVVHGDTGFAGSWAARARPGDRLQFEGPSGSYRPSPDVAWHLFAGDESAFGGIGASLESLAAGDRALVFALVDRPGCEINFPTAGEVNIVWLYREGADDPEALLADAIATAGFPEGSFDVFVHGEAAEVRAVRRHLVAERSVDPSTASISAYWRRHHTDEAWRKVKRQWMADQAADVLV
jgi:NADPH-dependent ferric siderophore reductase